LKPTRLIRPGNLPASLCPFLFPEIATGDLASSGSPHQKRGDLIFPILSSVRDNSSFDLQYTRVRVRLSKNQTVYVISPTPPNTLRERRWLGLSLPFKAKGFAQVCMGKIIRLAGLVILLLKGAGIADISMIFELPGLPAHGRLFLGRIWPSAYRTHDAADRKIPPSDRTSPPSLPLRSILLAFL